MLLEAEYIFSLPPEPVTHHRPSSAARFLMGRQPEAAGRNGGTSIRDYCERRILGSKPTSNVSEMLLERDAKF